MKNKLYADTFSKINLSDEKKNELTGLSYAGKRTNKIPFKKTLASVACVCCIAIIAVTSTYVSDNNNDIVSDYPFKIMQVYANNEKVDITLNQKVKTTTPFYQIKKTYMTRDEADKLFDTNDTKEDESGYSKEFFNIEYNTDGYMVTKSFNNFFDVEGENIVNVTVSAKHGEISCFFPEDLEILSGESVTLNKEEYKNEHKIMWNPSQKMYDNDIVREDFKYSDLNDEITFVVTSEINGEKSTEKIVINAEFDDEGIMYASVK